MYSSRTILFFFPAALTIALFSLATFQSLAQSGSIKGRVLDSKTLEPLPFANVFLNNTTIGTVTDTSGNFLLKNINQAGIYELVISFVGYESVKIKVTVGTGELNRGALRLIPSEVELSTVEVKGSRDKDWERKLKRFYKIFLGDDKIAEASTIINPWVIDFPDIENSNKFIATASAPLEIDNKALGYKIVFYLSYFAADSKGYIIQGNARFKEMETRDENERLRWEANRKLSYLHSSHHLFKSMIEHRIKGEGFRLYTDRPGSENVTFRAPYFYQELEKTVMPYDTTAMVTPDKLEGIFRIAIKGRLEVHYHKERAAIRTYRDVAFPVTWIKANRNFILVNKEGYELNPADVVISGAMSTDRIARILPIDYKPDQIPIIEEEISLSHFQENIYVHTDKPYYYPGEAMWFKGYINYGTSTWRDSLSRTAYVELIGPKDKITKSKILKIDSGFFHADFILPDTLTPGSYYLRAYTNFSRNFGDSMVYVKAIPVLKITDKVNQDQLPLEEEDNSIIITTDKTKYKPREKITLTVQLKDDEGKPLASSLSVSITDGTQVIPLLTAPGIHTEYPLKEIHAKSDKYTLPFPIEYGINFSGRFFNNENKPTKAMLNILQMNPKSLMLTQSDDNGMFTISELSFYDTAMFTVQASDEKNKAYGKAELVAREIPAMNFKHSAYPLNIIDAATAQRLISEYEVPVDSRLLQEVVVKGRKEVEAKDVRTYGKPDYVIKGKDINVAYGNLLFTLPGKFPGLIVRQASDPNGGIRWVIYSTRTLSLGLPREVLLTLNDVAISGNNPVDILANMDPSTVESIAYTSKINVLYGSQGQGGVLSIYTKTGPSDAINATTKNFQFLKVPGYSAPRKFRAPDYDDQQTDVSKADYRSTLYWNPEVKTDSNTGIATLSFFASDLSGRYHVVAEGVTSQGKPVRKEYTIMVENN